MLIDGNDEEQRSFCHEGKRPPAEAVAATSAPELYALGGAPEQQKGGAGRQTEGMPAVVVRWTNASVLPCNYLSAAPWAADVPTILGVTRQEIDFAPDDDVRNMSRTELASFVASKVQPYYGDDFTRRLLALYGLLQPEGGVDGVDGKKNSSEKSESGSTLELEEFEPQKTYAEIVSDATTFCPTLPLARAIDTAQRKRGKSSRRFRPAEDDASKPPPLSLSSSSSSSPSWNDVTANMSSMLWVYSTAQTPEAPKGYCPLAAYQAFDYCPSQAFHAIDMFMLFQPAYPSYPPIDPTNASSTDAAYSRQVFDALGQLATNGTVVGWETFAHDDDDDDDYDYEKMRGRSSRGDDVATKIQQHVRSYSIVDLRTSPQFESGMLRDFKRLKCELFLSNRFYEEKAWVN